MRQPKTPHNHINIASKGFIVCQKMLSLSNSQNLGGTGSTSGIFPAVPKNQSPSRQSSTNVAAINKTMNVKLRIASVIMSNPYL